MPRVDCLSRVFEQKAAKVTKKERRGINSGQAHQNLNNFKRRFQNVRALIREIQMHLRLYDLDKNQ